MTRVSVLVTEFQYMRRKGLAGQMLGIPGKGHLWSEDTQPVQRQGSNTPGPRRAPIPWQWSHIALPPFASVTRRSPRRPGWQRGKHVPESALNVNSAAQSAYFAQVSTTPTQVDSLPLPWENTVRERIWLAGGTMPRMPPPTLREFLSSSLGP